MVQFPLVVFGNWTMELPFPFENNRCCTSCPRFLPHSKFWLWWQGQVYSNQEKKSFVKKTFCAKCFRLKCKTIIHHEIVHRVLLAPSKCLFKWIKVDSIIEKSVHAISKILFILELHKFLACLECISRNGLCFGHSDLHPSSVSTKHRPEFFE